MTSNGGANQYFDGYLAEIHFCDGTAYAASDFGKFDDDGNWVPINPSVTYGTNGFHLDFADSADLGNDVSGNGNDFTPSGLTSADQVSDSPTNDADNGLGNYNVFSALMSGSTYTGEVKDGGLVTTKAGIGHAGMISHFPIGPTGKWYAEAKVIVSHSSCGLGVCATNSGYLAASGELHLGGTALGDYALKQTTGNTFHDNSNVAYGLTSTTNDIIMIAVDMDNGKIWWGKNGAWYDSGVPDEGTNAPFTDLSGQYYFAHSCEQGSTLEWDFGQSGFTYPPGATYDTEGFLAVASFNLDDPDIAESYCQKLCMG